MKYKIKGVLIVTILLFSCSENNNRLNTEHKTVLLKNWPKNIDSLIKNDLFKRYDQAVLIKSKNVFHFVKTKYQSGKPIPYLDTNFFYVYIKYNVNDSLKLNNYTFTNYNSQLRLLGVE